MLGMLKDTASCILNNAAQPMAWVLNGQNVCLHCGIWHWGFTAVGKVVALKGEVTLDE